MTTHACLLQMPDEEHFFDFIKENASMSHDMVEADSHTGESLVICGAGPSLIGLIGTLPLTNQVWACNSALPYLIDRGFRVTHGFAIDQSEGMLEDWARTFDVTYLLASSVNPLLIKHLKKSSRRIRYFHSYLGINDPEGWNGSEITTEIIPAFPCPWPLPRAKTPVLAQTLSYEVHLYKSLYPTSVQVGHGLNSVPRAVCLALACGFTDIRVYGADCAALPGQAEMPETGEDGYLEWMESVRLYADGRPASIYGESVMCEAEIDGKRWTTRPDMVISAQHLLNLQNAFPDRITFHGDTLPNALRGKDKIFWSNSPVLRNGQVSNFRTMKVA